ncbi:MAG TPA: GNAT family N-acetyltransferase [Blastocatellia bacterium]|nr:GNAT family N-acetyltransferase [Blastocatellia bacterium]
MFSRYKFPVTLRDGSTMRVRPIRPEDDAKLLDLYHRLSNRSLYNRFLTVPDPDPSKAAYLARVDYHNHFALVGEVGGVGEVGKAPEKIIAVARYFRDSDRPDRAEAAFTVADDYQRQGIGQQMLALLSQVAFEQGITTLEGHVLAQNRPMMKVLSRSGFNLSRQVEAGVFLVSLSLGPPPLP